MNCKFCGAQLPPQQKGKRRREYCNDAHRQRYFQQHKKTVSPQVALVDQDLASRVNELEQITENLTHLLVEEQEARRLLELRVRGLEPSIKLTQELLISAQATIAKQQQEIETLEERIRLIEIDTKSSEQINQEIDELFQQPGMQTLLQREKAKLASSEEIPQIETTFDLADFTQPLQSEYRSSATRGDVKAWLTLRPNPKAGRGDYSIDYWSYDKAVRSKGAMKRDQKERGEQLKTDLKTAVLKALGQAGWKEVMYGVYACPGQA